MNLEQKMQSAFLSNSLIELLRKMRVGAWKSLWSRHTAAKSRTPPKAGVAAARQLCHNNKEVMERLLLMRPDSSSGGNCNLLPLPTAWTTEGPNPRIWNPKPSAESGIFIVLEMKGKSKLPSWDMHTIRWNWHCVCVQSSETYSLGLVLTSTRRGPLLLKHCLRRASTSEKGLRNTRSPFIANNFLPTSRPAILKENMKNKRNK